ncbi:hypothetical protein [Haloferula rosea]|uniref:Uncharacterized protein n=1 Tax=Haloferula rosea TaxID=490093 RepID=A0A934RD66_9BACT|nr:hypothetical protein [Haloferula rosea]MBK1827548.1 hypothetical protein [Haloferula rosea]
MNESPASGVITIRQNRCSWWTAASLIAAVAMLGLSVVGMLGNLPPSASFEWGLLPLLFLVSAAMAVNYGHQILHPRDHIISIAADSIRIVDSNYGKWRDFTLAPDQVDQFADYEEGAIFIMKSRKAFALSSTLSIRSREIAEALKQRHPHISCVNR